MWSRQKTWGKGFLEWSTNSCLDTYIQADCNQCCERFSETKTMIILTCITCCAKNYTVRSTEITMGPFKIIAFEFNWLHLNSIGCIASTFDEGSKISQNIIIVKVERILNFWRNRRCMSRWSLFSSLKIFHNIDYDQLVKVS